MHQPYYRDMVTSECIQPWVRLHGIHSYYDMLKLYEEYPDIQGCINFVPSLLKQLVEIAEGGLSDKFWEVSKTDAKELTHDQKIFILRNFFMANHDRMIKPHPRYFKLFQRRGADLSKVDFDGAIRYFSWKDYLDIQVYYNLVWFGFKAREEFLEIDRMLSITSSGSNFTEDDKKFVMDTQIKVLKRLLVSIKNAPKNIELTTSPFFHPIMPLLINTDIAKRCMPDTPLPKKVLAQRHALFQLQHGLSKFEQVAGTKPAGLWPSEGSVCPEMVPMLESAGIKWIATDEGILERSGVKGKRSEYLYQPYTVEHEESSITAIFRDRELSDLVSFTYAKMPADAAANDFIGRIKEISKASHVEAPLVTVLLDGENPWESYECAGGAFLKNLFEGIRREKIKTTTVGGYLAEHPPRNKITTLYSGSWINSNYAIWIGKPQKNQAWDYIKRAMDELGPKLSDALENTGRGQRELMAMESFGAACGSDWFWWFDDDFESEFKSDFDKIFRMHLKNTFTLLGKDVPVYLFQPIHHYKEGGTHSQGAIRPAAFVNPTIDGLNTSFFEWMNAVKIDVGGNRGPMGQTKELLENIYAGFNPKGLFMKFEQLDKNVTFSLHDEEELVIYLHNRSKYKLRLFFDGKKYQMQYANIPEEGYSNGSHKIRWAVRSVFEFAVDFADLGYKPGDEVTIIVTVVKRGLEVRHYSHITFIVPDENYEREMWSV